MSAGGFRRVLGNPRFRRMWLATGISELGSNVGRMAFLLLIHQLAREAGEPPAGAVALVLALETIPMLLFGPFAGALVDRLDRRALLVGCDVVAGLMLLAIPHLAELGVRWPLYAIALLFSIISTVFHPAQKSAIPDLVERADLPAANGLATATTSVSLVLGMAIAGALIEGLGKAGCFYVDAATFAVSGALLAALPLPRHGAGRHAREFAREVLLGIAFVTRKPMLVYLSMVFLATFAFLGTWYPTLPAYSEDVLGGDADRWVPATLSCFGLGGLVGATVIARLARSVQHGRLLVSTLGLALVTMQLYAWTPMPYASLALAALGGALVFALMVLDTTVLHERTPAALRGRVFGARPPLQATGMLVGTGVVLTLAGSVAPATLLRGSAAGYALVAVALTLCMRGARELITRSVRD